ncbi:hypothetical protein AGMMS49949_08890 [Alphaproteobacteria bacterium]|nr:hypothetical protein AGMMS49949_08890 [Alphaproteobacteria bacterium]GHS99882.1 hypothetical protein AGMMS50296_8130 [Alphaproteobacteria bacterium]
MLGDDSSDEANSPTLSDYDETLWCRKEERAKSKEGKRRIRNELQRRIEEQHEEDLKWDATYEALKNRYESTISINRLYSVIRTSPACRTFIVDNKDLGDETLLATLERMAFEDLTFKDSCRGRVKYEKHIFNDPTITKGQPGKKQIAFSVKTEYSQTLKDIEN